MTALDMLTELRVAGLSIPFVIVTGFGSIDSALEAGRRGASGFVEKPLFEDDLLKLVDAYKQSPPSSSRSPGTIGRIAHFHAVRVVEFIESKYADPQLKIGSVAAELGISIPHLCRLLKPETGDSFLSLLRHVRIRVAARLLRTTSLTKKEIAAQVGFNSHGHFDRVFKTTYSMSPTAYRSAARHQPLPRDVPEALH